MRALRIPLFALLALLLLSLANGAAMDRSCRRWTELLDSADAAAAAEQWGRAETLLA